MHPRKRERPDTCDKPQRQSQMKNHNPEAKDRGSPKQFWVSKSGEGQSLGIKKETIPEKQLSKSIPSNQKEVKLEEAPKEKNSIKRRIYLEKGKQQSALVPSKIQQKPNSNENEDLNSEATKGMQSRKRGNLHTSVNEIAQKEEKPKRDCTIQRKLFVTHFSRAHTELKLRHETFVLAVMVMDDLFKIKKPDNLQIFPQEVFTCFFLAAKFEQIYPPRFARVSEIFGMTMPLKEYVCLEMDILVMLNLTINARRGPYYCMHRFPAIVQAQRTSNQVRSFVRYMIELASFEERVWLKFSDQQILEAITFFLKKNLDWSRLESSPAERCYQLLKQSKSWSTYRNPIFYKYSKAQHHFCSTLEPPKLF